MLFYVGLHDHLSVGSDGDYLALGVVDNRVVLQFNLGSGAVSVASGPLSSGQGWFTILAGRMGREGYLYVDNQVKEARSPPPLVGLNVFGRLYLGGVPEFSMLNDEVSFTKTGNLGFDLEHNFQRLILLISKRVLSSIPCLTNNYAVFCRYHSLRDFEVQ